MVILNWSAWLELHATQPSIVLPGATLCGTWPAQIERLAALYMVKAAGAARSTIALRFRARACWHAS